MCTCGYMDLMVQTVDDLLRTAANMNPKYAAVAERWTHCFRGVSLRAHGLRGTCPNGGMGFWTISNRISLQLLKDIAHVSHNSIHLTN